MTNERPKFPELDFGTIGPQMRTASEFTINKVDREWPAQWRNIPGADALVETLLRTSLNTYRTIIHLCLDEVQWPQRTEYTLSCGPLNRTLLDSLFTILFLFEDLKSRTVWFYHAGWVEMREEYERHKKAYGNDPDWHEWLDAFSRGIDNGVTTFSVPAAVVNGSTKVPKWPLPGSMRKDKHTSADRKKYMEHLYDWHYKALSSQSHLSLPGLIIRSAALLPKKDEEEEARVWRLDKQRSDNAAVAIVLWLAMMSEIEMEMRFGQRDRLAYIWTLIISFFGLAKEIYDLRIAHRL